MSSSEMHEPEINPAVEEDEFANIPYEELQSIYHDVLSIFRKGRDEDCHKLDAILKKRAEKVEQWQTELSKLQKQTQVLEKEVNEIDQLTQEEIGGCDTDGLAQVTTQKETTQDQLDKLSQRESELRDELQHLEAHIKSTQAKSGEFRMENKNLQQLEYALSLYANVTGIKWTEPATSLSGMAYSRKNSTCAQISPPGTTESDYAVANTIWSIIDQLNM